MPTLEWVNREAAVRAATCAPFRLLEHDPALSFGDPGPSGSPRTWKTAIDGEQFLDTSARMPRHWRIRYAQALDKLQNDVLPKTDGCARTGAPDANDRLKDCAAQKQVSAVITEAVSLLEDLL